VEKFFRKFYPSCKNYMILSEASDIKPNRENIINAINWLTDGLVSGENVYLHFCGHGGLIINQNKRDIYKKDNCIYPFDDGIFQQLHNDEIRKLLINKIPIGSKCFVLFDCCYDGNELDLNYKIKSNQAGLISYEQNDLDDDKLVGSIIFLSSYLDTSLSLDIIFKTGLPNGYITKSLIEAWLTYGINIKFKYLLWNIKKFYNEKGYTQIPQLFSANDVDVNDIFNLN